MANMIKKKTKTWHYVVSLLFPTREVKQTAEAILYLGGFMLVHQWQGILYLVILNRADFSTQVLSVVLPHIPAGSKSKVKSHTEPCCLVSIPFGRISTFFGYLQFMLYVSLSGPFAPDSLLIDCYAHRLEVQLWVVQSNALFSVIKSKTIPVHVEETINFQLKALEFIQLKLCV